MQNVKKKFRNLKPTDSIMMLSHQKDEKFAGISTMKNYKLQIKASPDQHQEKTCPGKAHAARTHVKDKLDNAPL